MQAEATKNKGLPNAIANGTRRLLAARESGVFLVLVILYVSVWFVSPIFRTQFNQISILRQMTVFAVLAIGQTMCIVIGGFDLSQGPVAALVGVLAGTAIKTWGWQPLVAIAFGFALSLACGLFNGFLVTRLRFVPVVSTLASSSIFSAVLYGITRGNPAVDLPPAYTWLGLSLIHI